MADLRGIGQETSRIPPAPILLFPLPQPKSSLFGKIC